MPAHGADLRLALTTHGEQVMGRLPIGAASRRA